MKLCVAFFSIFIASTLCNLYGQINVSYRSLRVVNKEINFEFLAINHGMDSIYIPNIFKNSDGSKFNKFLFDSNGFSFNTILTNDSMSVGFKEISDQSIQFRDASSLGKQDTNYYRLIRRLKGLKLDDYLKYRSDGKFVGSYVRDGYYFFPGDTVYFDIVANLNFIERASSSIDISGYRLKFFARQYCPPEYYLFDKTFKLFCGDLAFESPALGNCLNGFLPKGGRKLRRKYIDDKFRIRLTPMSQIRERLRLDESFCPKGRR